ncbi:hypothetical protein GQ367_01770 [Polynucleobacter sp. MWH-CaK5]|uniref:hypothetical protein n=1 Tax=Polynucleobacter sp. MWH-CaK5 TaxID=2689107 RepID=UPI001BFE33B8|nr:hypothetical protein [Polynucleobacter sp. MWH-CaK5]QWD89229.1 hypothetical protein GQ367_01770 [Polynucleobacter sp. MWH-CaK5]
MNDFNFEEISKKSDEELKKILSWLSMEPIINDRIQHRAIIQAMVINQILFQRHIDGVEKRARTAQRVSIGLAFLALIVSIISITFS